MLRNKFKDRKTECVFDNEPLSKAYAMICNLVTPYIWYTGNSNGEHLYLINDIETQRNVPSYGWQIDDIEFIDPEKDVIGLRLCRMSGKNVTDEYITISCRSNFVDENITAESLIKQAGLRIPEASEFETVNFTGDIPGNTKEVDEELTKKRMKYLQEIISDNEGKSEMYGKKLEILETVLRSLQYDIEQYRSRVKSANQQVERARKELTDLQAN